jgi:hypothetical protein
MNSWITNIYKAFIFVSAILFIIALNTSGITSINATISGYSTMTISLLIIIMVVINNFNQTINGDLNYIQVIFNALFTMGPFILILGIIGFLLYILIYYKKVISEGHISSYYYTFSFLSSMLALLQIFILYNGTTSRQFQKTHLLSKITNSIVCFTAVINSICALILFIILKYYTTDGYQNLI